jgi:hypothetical protein
MEDKMSALHHETKAAKPAAAPVPPAPAVAPRGSPGVGYSGNNSHDANVATATLTKQTAEAAAGGSQSALNAAAIAFHRAVARSAIQNGCSPSVSMSALKSLGVTGL